jgi:hypothetical protein
MVDLKTLLAGVQFVEKLWEVGKPAWDAVLETAAAHGVVATDDLLRAIAADADRRKAIAEAEAKG